MTYLLEYLGDIIRRMFHVSIPPEFQPKIIAAVIPALAAIVLWSFLGKRRRSLLYVILIGAGFCLFLWIAKDNPQRFSDFIVELGAAGFMFLLSLLYNVSWAKRILVSLLATVGLYIVTKLAIYGIDLALGVRSTLSIF